MKKKKRNSIKNNIYALKLLWRLCPSMVVHMAVSRFLGYFEWLFYSAFFMRYVINALETQQAFSSIMTFLGITIGVFASISFYSSYVDGKVMPVKQEIVFKKLNLALFEKSSNVELSCFEDSDFYNKYTLAMDKADDNLIQTVSNIWGVLFGMIAAIASFLLI